MSSVICCGIHTVQQYCTYGAANGAFPLQYCVFQWESCLTTAHAAGQSVRTVRPAGVSTRSFSPLAIAIFLFAFGSTGYYDLGVWSRMPAIKVRSIGFQC